MLISLEKNHKPHSSTEDWIHMSRHSIPAYDQNHFVVVGWDAPLTTFFAQVEDLTISDEQKALLLWIGDSALAIPTINQLQAEIAPYATIPTEVIEQLQAGYDQAWAPSPMQQFARQLIADTTPRTAPPSCTVVALEPLPTELIGKSVWCVSELRKGQWNPDGARSAGTILKVFRCLNPKYQAVLIESPAFEQPEPFSLDHRGVLWNLF